MIRTPLLMLAAAALGAAPASAQTAREISPEVNARLREATVYMETVLELSARDWASFPAEARERMGRRPSEAASGSGFLISPDGYIITNAHVVDGMTLLIQYTPNGVQTEMAPPGSRHMPFDAANPTKPFTLTLTPSSFKAVVRSGEKPELERAPKLVKIDRKADLALLKISSPEPLPFLELDKETEVSSGMVVVMTGFPGGATPDIAPFAEGGDPGSLGKRHPRASVNAGMVTAIREYQGEKRYQLDIRANHGNSGGPITDFAGRVVGVLYAGIDSMQSINYAIPASYIDQVLPSKLRGGAADGSAEGEAAGNPSYDDFLKNGKFKFKKK